MTLLVFGKGDAIAVPKMSPMFGDVAYTKDPFDLYYSEYGFAFPMTTECVPLHILLDNKIPESGIHVDQISLKLTFLLIDHNGILWKIITAQIDDEIDRRYKICYFYIDTLAGGWWTNFGDLANNADQQLLRGYLYTEPSKKEIDDFYFTHHGSQRLLWLSIDEITKTLNEKYPPLSNKEKTRKLLSDVGISVPSSILER